MIGLERIGAEIVLCPTQIGGYKSRTQGSSRWSWWAIVALHWRPREPTMELKDSIHLPSTKGFPDEVMAVLKDRQIVEPGNEQVVGHDEIRRSSVPCLARWIKRISRPAGSIPRALIKTPAELILAGKLKAARVAACCADIEGVEVGVDVPDQKVGRVQNAGVGKDSVQSDDSLQFAALATLIAGIKNKAARQLMLHV